MKRKLLSLVFVCILVFTFRLSAHAQPPTPTSDPNLEATFCKLVTALTKGDKQLATDFGTNLISTYNANADESELEYYGVKSGVSPQSNIYYQWNKGILNKELSSSLDYPISAEWEVGLFVNVYRKFQNDWLSYWVTPTYMYFGASDLTFTYFWEKDEAGGLYRTGPDIPYQYLNCN